MCKAASEKIWQLKRNNNGERLQRFLVNGRISLSWSECADMLFYMSTIWILGAKWYKENNSLNSNRLQLQPLLFF